MDILFMEEVMLGRYSKKNIGIFTHDLYPFKPWGQGRYVYDLVRCLRGKVDNEIYVFSPSEGIVDEFHVQLFKGSHSTLGKNITFSIKLNNVLDNLIKKYNLGLIHLQGGPGGLFLFKKPGVPCVYTVHHTYHQQSRYIPGQSWKRILFLFERYGYHLADYLICDSPSTLKNLLKHYGLANDKCCSIPIGVNRDQFHPLSIKKIPDSIFFLGRLEKRKGIDYLIKTIPIVKKQIKDIQLFIGGDGKLKKECESFVRKNQLEDNVHFPGVLNDNAINQWYNRVSIVVIPSVFEGFGLTAIEAMSCGTPVIASNVDGLCDVIEDGVNGLLVNYNDTLNLSKRITNLLNDKTQQKKYTINGEKKVVSVYNWDKICVNVLNIYEKLLFRENIS